LVLDENEKIIYYAISNNEKIDLNVYNNKYVSLIGMVRFDTFGKVRLLYVDRLIDLSPAK